LKRQNIISDKSCLEQVAPTVIEWPSKFIGEWRASGCQFEGAIDSFWPIPGIVRTGRFDPLLPVATVGFAASNRPTDL
jgi:hypothetical protein